MTKPSLLAIIGGVVVVAAIILNILLENVEEEELIVRHPPPITAPKSPSGQDKIAGKKSLALNPSNTPKKQVYEPSFDTIRVNRDGDAVIVGRAAPWAKVEILDNEKQIGEVQADKRGEWVFVPSSPIPPGTRQFSLKMMDSDGKQVSSKDPVIMIIPEKGKDIAGRLTQDATQPLVIKVPTGDTGSVEVLQKTIPPLVGESAIEFFVDAIDYNALGKLSISGRALQQALVQIYLNNKFIGRTYANDRGIWKLAPRDAVKAGVYTLRADHIDTTGKVLARREVIFARSVPLTRVKPGSLVVVEPGNSLWRIARRTYGSGFQYTVIYEANKEQIIDEDLIFPGQVFSLPPTD